MDEKDIFPMTDKEKLSAVVKVLNNLSPKHDWRYSGEITDVDKALCEIYRIAKTRLFDIYQNGMSHALSGPLNAH